MFITIFLAFETPRRSGKKLQRFNQIIEKILIKSSAIVIPENYDTLVSRTLYIVNLSRRRDNPFNISNPFQSS